MYQRIAGQMLFQKESGQLLAYKDGQILPLRKGDELFLVHAVEHPLESSLGAKSPILA